VSLSGLIGANVGSAVPVLGAWAKYINDNGGIACHPVQVYWRDDASDPGKSSSAVQDLVRSRKAIALVADFMPLAISGFRSALDQMKVPAVGGDLFTPDWWSDPLLYPVGTHIDANAVGATVAQVNRGATKVGLVYCIESPACPPYRAAIREHAATSGYSVVYDGQVSITAPDYTTQCQNAKNAGADQLSMILTGDAVARIARSCAAIGYFPKFAIASLGAIFSPADKYLQKMSVAIASASNDWFTAGSPGQQEFQAAMKRYVPTLKLDPTSALAWADAMMLKVAIDKLGSAAVGVPVTTEMLFQGLSMIKNETLGDMVKPNSFSPTRGPNPPNPCYYSMIFSLPDAIGQWQRTASGCVKGIGSMKPGSADGASVVVPQASSLQLSCRPASERST
jgi:branched-chain amino acid transport system substrate-binding protein